MTNSKKVRLQVQSFYNLRPAIKHKDQVSFIITDNVFTKRMEMAQTIRDKEITEQNKSFLQQVNGNVVWGKTNQDPITVLISSKVFQVDTFTWQGTVHHEYTHAHDFWELADYLKLTEMDDIYDYEYYYPFEWWSEYRARKAGAMNVYQNEYANRSTADIHYICQTMFEDISTRLMHVSSAYDAMQLFGRYSALKEMYDQAMPELSLAQSRFGLGDTIIAIAEFLHSHQEFESIRDKFGELEVLVNSV